jgi:hypothetical protein
VIGITRRSEILTRWLTAPAASQAKSWYNSQQEINAMDDKAVKHRWYIIDSAM